MVIGQLMREACLLGSSNEGQRVGIFALSIGYCRIPFGNGDDGMRDGRSTGCPRGVSQPRRNGRLGRSFRISSQCGGEAEAHLRSAAIIHGDKTSGTEGDRGESVTLEGQCERGWDKEIEHGGGKKGSTLNRRPGVAIPSTS